jgi:hypothetical protein
VEVKNKDGSFVKLIEIKKVKLPRGRNHLLEKVAMYSPNGKEWYYDAQDIENLIKSID